MTTATLVLVVAPERDFRRSLEFALEAEGFAVETHARTSDAFVSTRAQEADCTVIDDAAIEDWRAAEEQFRRFGRPVILLVGRIRPVPDLPFTTILTKPFLGTPLIETVRELAAHGA
ncbi:hypothetical protein [Mesorhizobium sp. CN2-181]|uniref:hypothetical protein n=1 Tax=Mesorhizobium yinganensis TaxID=3157707 RepID=UPI0032B817B5